jgi:hypothetical protein
MGRAIEELSKQPPKGPSLGQEILTTLFPPLQLIPLKHQLDEADKVYAKHLQNIEEENKKFKPGDAPFDPKKTKQYKQGLDELAQALADFNKVQREANEERERIAVAEAHDFLDRDQAATLLIAIEEKLFEAQKKRIEAERDNAQLNAKTQDQRAAAAVKAEDAIANARSQTDIKESQIIEKRDKENDAANEKLVDRAIEEDKKERELVDARRAFKLKSEEDTQKAIDQATAIKDRPGTVTQSDLIVAGIKDQVDALGPLTKAWGELKEGINDALVNSADLFTNFTDVAINGLKGLVDALQTTLETFIITGKLGAQAFRTLTAALLVQLTIEAFQQVLKMHAKAVEETGYAAADLAVGDYAGFLLHSLAAEHFAHAAIAWGAVGVGAAAAGIGIGASGGLGGGGARGAAAGGGFGGENQAPGTVTINQGAGGTLGIQLQQLNALNNISNTLSTASPGDVVTRGAEQNPVAIGQANNEAARRDGTVSREFLQISGLRTA